MKKLIVLGLMLVLLLPTLPLAVAEEEESPVEIKHDYFLIMGRYSNAITGNDGNPGALVSPNTLFITGLDKASESQILPFWFYCRFAKRIDYEHSRLFGFGVPTQTGPPCRETGESGFIFAYCTGVNTIFP